MSHTHYCSGCANKFECFYSDNDCAINEGDVKFICNDCEADYENYIDNSEFEHDEDF
jgi:hypothetical protein